MKRLLNCTASEISGMTPADILASIKANSGRTIAAENDVVIPPFAGGITNSEVVASFGADMVLLNCFDFDDMKVIGIDEGIENPITELKRLTGKLIGVNLEPIDTDAEFETTILSISKGRVSSVENLEKAKALGVDFICLTGNPGTGVSNKEILKAIEAAKHHFGGVIVAGKMHSAGVNEPLISNDIIDDFSKAGADIIMVPTAGTVPGFSEVEMTDSIKQIHINNKLAMSTIGTTQEGADTGTIRELALTSKRAGSDIQHIGDAGFNGTADPENILQLSITIRGKRHTYKKIAQSINR